MRSAEHVDWDLHMVTGPARATAVPLLRQLEEAARAVAVAARPMMDAIAAAGAEARRVLVGLNQTGGRQ